MLLLNSGGWSLRLRAESGPGLEEREGEAWVGRLGTGEGVVQAYRPGGASLHLLWADTQQHPCLPQRVSGPRGWPGRPWTRGDWAWRLMTPAILQVSVSQRTHEGTGAGRT